VKTATLNRLSVCISALSIVAYACAGGNTGELPAGELSGGSGANGGAGGSLPTVNGGSGGTAGSGMAGGGSGGTGGGLPGTGGGFIDPTTAGSAGMAMVDEDAACGTGMANADLKPVNMLVMFDRSGSMHDCTDGTDRDQQELCPSPPSRWDTASGALKAFFASPGAADLGVALRFFPHDSPAVGCSGGQQATCDAMACSQVLVDMGVLTADAAPTDAHEAALVAATDMATPPDPAGMTGANQGTPIYAALEGALIWASAYQLAHPEQRTVVVFVTDGAPNGCNTDFDDISQLAADALAASTVTTYMIGLTDAGGGGVNQDDMDQVAAAGGTMQAFFVSDGATAAQELIDTFNAIRGMAISCEFAVPVATSGGMPIDPNLLNVNYTAGTGSEVPLVKVANAAACGAEPAWYYDNETMPTQILLCPTACTTVTADPNAQIQILAGCKPRIPTTT